MLHKIRKTTDSLIFRAFLIIVAIAFAWSYRDAIGGIGDRDIVSFKGAAPIKRSEFERARFEEITRLQKAEGMNFTEEQIEQMDISSSVLQKLITARLVKFLSAKYDLDFSDAAIADVIRKLPMFKDADNRFDIERFKSYLRINNLTPDEYSDEVKDYLSQTILLGGFVGNFYMPNSRIKNIVDFMSEKRVVDIAVVSLASNEAARKNPGDKELKNFYNENKDLFKSPWTRDICYIAIQSNNAKNNKVKVDNAEVKSFYKENKAEFKGQSYAKAATEIKKYLLKEKFDYWIGEVTKTLDDDVAGGMNLSEIAARHSLSMVCEKNISEANIAKKASGLFVPFLGEVREMSEGEVSYPADIEDGGVMLFEVTKYSSERLEEFASVKNKVIAKYNIFSHRQEKIKIAQDFADKTSSSKFINDAKRRGMGLRIARPFVRIEASDINNYPESMVRSIFEADTNSVIGPFMQKDKAYLGIVRRVLKDKVVQKNMQKEKREIASSIKEGLFEELLEHVRIASDMKIKVNPALLRNVRK